jgi:hypothetical protein
MVFFTPTAIGCTVTECDSRSPKLLAMLHKRKMLMASARHAMHEMDSWRVQSIVDELVMMARELHVLAEGMEKAVYFVDAVDTMQDAVRLYDYLYAAMSKQYEETLLEMRVRLFSESK